MSALPTLRILLAGDCFVVSPDYVVTTPRNAAKPLDPYTPRPLDPRPSVLLQREKEITSQRVILPRRLPSS